MTHTFQELATLARTDARKFRDVPRHECLAVVRQHSQALRTAVRERHEAGESGRNVVHMLSEAADEILRGVFDFATAHTTNRATAISRLALCALGGYGRSQLSPASDLDVCLICEGRLTDDIKELNAYLLTFMWDLGYQVGYALRSIPETLELARDDIEVFTSFVEARFLVGDNTVFARQKLLIRDLQSRYATRENVERRIRERQENLSAMYADLYSAEPDLKNSSGGLRDVHTALWLLMAKYGPLTLDETPDRGIVTADEYLALSEGLDFVWRARNELHFHHNKPENRLTFANQRHLAIKFGYGGDSHEHIARFMEDYYAAARVLHQFLRRAALVCSAEAGARLSEAPAPQAPEMTIENGELCVGLEDPHWYEENPARLMEVFWECARRRVFLSAESEHRIRASLPAITDIFQTNDLARRFFVAICSRPFETGAALRQAAQLGVLQRYLPEFAAVEGIIRYEDFHSFPVNEHTLRALEAVGDLNNAEHGTLGCLRTAVETLHSPHILMLAILFHDLGKIVGDIHTEKSVEITRTISHRIGLSADDEEQVVFLVHHHSLMTNLSQYRDIDEEEVVRTFAQTVNSAQRLQALFVLSYADLSAVGPNVWNDWKGALLLGLYLRAERLLMGRAEISGERFWESPKVMDLEKHLPAHLKGNAAEHVRTLGDRYLNAFPVAQLAIHVECLAEARSTGLSVHCINNDDTGMSEFVVCTRDRAGLFSTLTGGFAAHLIDVNSAALFTGPDGYVVDCFTVTDATHKRPLTSRQIEGINALLHAVLMRGEDIQSHVDNSRRRLFALLQPRIPVPISVTFDNNSSRKYTVIDVEAGDRTGLLFDITRTMTDFGLDIASARIVTDARRVRDAFYVTLNGQKVADVAQQETLSALIRDAAHAVTNAQEKGEISCQELEF